MATYLYKEPPKPDTPVYTVDLPGAADLFHFAIPSLYDKEAKMERIKRFQTKKSPVPEPLQWIPDVINQIDDAQDLLTTALYLSRPLIKRLPSRFIPFVGWALTISDIANLCTFILGTAMTPGLMKPDVYKTFKDKKFSKGDMKKKVSDWMKPMGWRRHVGQLLQAAQASETVTGIGLTLGAVMGCASELIWSPYRAARGERVEIRLPPEKDPLTKAYRFISGAPKQFFYRDILDPWEHALILAAQNVAIGIIQEQGTKPPDDRVNDLMLSRVPNYIPWEQSSKEALQESGFDLSRENFYKPYMVGENPLFQDAIDRSVVEMIGYTNALRVELGTGDGGSIFYTVGREAGTDCLTHLTGITEDEMFDYSYDQMCAIKLSELNFTLLTPSSQRKPMQNYTWLYVATVLANKLGRKYPNLQDWSDATKAMGWTWGPKY